jgi:hypothetical protein
VFDDPDAPLALPSGNAVVLSDRLITFDDHWCNPDEQNLLAIGTDEAGIRYRVGVRGDVLEVNEVGEYWRVLGQGDGTIDWSADTLVVEWTGVPGYNAPGDSGERNVALRADCDGSDGSVAVTTAEGERESRFAVCVVSDAGFSAAFAQRDGFSLRLQGAVGRVSGPGVERFMPGFGYSRAEASEMAASGETYEFLALGPSGVGLPWTLEVAAWADTGVAISVAEAGDSFSAEGVLDVTRLTEFVSEDEDLTADEAEALIERIGVELAGPVSATGTCGATLVVQGDLTVVDLLDLSR